MSINEILEQKNITKYRLWKESGVPQATISDICTGKTRIEKCSAETIYRIAKVLDVSMESLIAPAVRSMDEERRRPSFEVFKSNTCHRVKDMGDIPFIIQLLKSSQIKFESCMKRSGIRKPFTCLLCWTTFPEKTKFRSVQTITIFAARNCRDRFIRPVLSSFVK